MIRAAAPTDIQRLIEMGHAYFVEAGWEKYAPFDVDSFAFTCSVLGNSGVLLVGESDDGHVVGMIGMGLTPLAFNRNVHTAQEICWYCEPTHRKKVWPELLAANEEALKARGVSISSMISEEGRKEACLGQNLMRKGYVPVERTYWKAL